jgi:hypothetical protein
MGSPAVVSSAFKIHAGSQFSTRLIFKPALDKKSPKTAGIYASGCSAQGHFASSSEGYAMIL